MNLRNVWGTEYTKGRRRRDLETNRQIDKKTKRRETGNSFNELHRKVSILFVLLVLLGPGHPQCAAPASVWGHLSSSPFLLIGSSARGVPAKGKERKECRERQGQPRPGTGPQRAVRQLEWQFLGRSCASNYGLTPPLRALYSTFCHSFSQSFSWSLFAFVFSASLLIILAPHSFSALRH